MKTACVVFPTVFPKEHPSLNETVIGCWIRSGGHLPIRTCEQLKTALLEDLTAVEINLRGDDLLLSARSTARTAGGVSADANRFAAAIRKRGIETLVTPVRTPAEVRRLIA